MKEDYERRYPDIKDKSHVLYWGYDEEAFHTYAQKNLSRTEILLHAGNIFDFQNPKVLWTTLRKEIDNGRNLRIVFVGTVGPGIRHSIKEAGLENRTEYKGFLPYQTMIEELGAASYLLVCATEKRHVPGKLFEYLRSGKPILAFGDSNEEVKTILSETHAGMIVPLASNGKEFFKQPRRFRTDLNSVQRFDRKIISGKLADILNEYTTR
jgi:glycosyltransferase involved in cell wall biosynthesis